MSAGAYCRAVESYLCRKNDGHLIRIVGPAFALVLGWEQTGIPMRVVERAIDRTFERYHARGPKRRPLRIEYCEDDVVEQFEAWTRAVGVGGAAKAARAGGETAPRRRRRSLAAHLDEVQPLLRAWGDTPPARTAGGLAARVEAVGAAIDALRAAAPGLRGAARARLLGELARGDDTLRVAARAAAGSALLAELTAEATASLEPFRSRMTRPAFQAAVDAATDRLLIEHFRLPRLDFK